MSRQPRPPGQVRPRFGTQPQRPHVILRPSVTNVSFVPVVYGRSYAPSPFINHIQPAPRIFTHAPVFTAPPHVSRSQGNEIPSQPSSLDRQSPHIRIAPSPTPSPAPSPVPSPLSTISSVYTDTDNVSKIK